MDPQRIILFLSPLRNGWKEPIESLRNEFPEVQFITTEKTENTASYLPKAEGIIPYRITADQIRLAQRLKIIFIPWSGTDSLPLDAIMESGCMVANTHGNASSVAEHAITLALSAMHRLIPYHLDLQNGYWHGFIKGFSEADQWNRLTGKRCAVLGVVEIGALVARILQSGFHCQVKGWKKNPIKETLPFFDVVSTSLEEVLQDSEVVFITLPLTSSTKHLFHQGNMHLLSGKVVVNVGRGGIFEEKALYDSLKNSQILCAGIDVWYNYPFDKIEPKFPGHYPFHTLPNLVMSPHIGGYSKEGQTQMMIDTMTNIRSYLKTGQPVWKIQLEKGY